MKNEKNHAFSEIFPIQEDNLPKLWAYSLDFGGGEPQKVGGKLSFRLRKEIGGDWAYADRRLISDTKQEKEKLDDVLERAWKSQPEIYRNLRGIRLDEQWKPSVYAKSRFVSLLKNQQLLQRHTHQLIQL